MFIRKDISQLIRFLLFGGFALIVEWGTFVLLINKSNIFYIFATVISFWIGATLAFLLNNRFNFNYNGLVSNYVAYPKYLMVNLFCSALDALIIWLVTELYKFPENNVELYFGKAISIISVAMVSFYLHKKWTFRKA